MATEPAPPVSGASNAKYAIVGAGLLLGAVLVYFGMDCGKSKPPPGPPDAGTVERSTVLQETELEIPEPEPDAGPPFDAGPPRTKVVYRYERSSWDCSGEIPKAAASAVINQNRRQIRNCYERALKRNHTLAGSLSLRARVGRAGTVTGVQVGGSLRDPEVFSCVRNLAQSWRFPAPTGGACVVVGQSFAMNPRK